MGGIRTPAAARAAIDAGAQFLVTPITAPEILSLARAERCPVVCGALSPTEVEAAYRAGATLVKVFPVAAMGGPAYIRQLRSPLHDVPLVPTGGVGLDDIADYAKAGAAAVALGSALTSGQPGADLQARCAHALRAWRQAAASVALPSHLSTA